MTATLEDLGTLTEEELADLICGEDDSLRAAAVAVLDQRDEAARRYAAGHGRRRMQDTAWAEAAHAQYLQAEERCRGHLLSRKGKAAGVTEWSLWTGPEHVARAHASEELNALWDDQGRITVSQWRDAMAADRREEYETACREHAEAKGTETEPMIGYVARAAVRAATTPSRHPGGQGMTQEQLNANKSVQNVRERIQAQREQRAAVAAVSGMVAEAQQAQEARKAHQAVAVPAQSAPVRQRQHVDGQAVLGYVRAWLAHYARWPSESALDAVTLWVAHACAKDGDGVMVWEATPRLMFLSSAPGSGKSRALELVSLLCASRYGLMAEPTAAVVAHMLGSMHEPAFFDEADVLFGSGKRKEALRALLNSGYTRAGITLHMSRGKPVELPVFGPVALAGLDVVKTGTSGNLAPLLDRSIIIRMRKSADRVPQLNGKTRAEGGMLHAALAAWCQQERDTLSGTEAVLPDWLTGRAAEIWVPLFVLAGTAGGDWPERVMMAAEDLALAPELAGEETDDLMAGLAGMASGWGE